MRWLRKKIYNVTGEEEADSDHDGDQMQLASDGMETETVLEQ